MNFFGETLRDISNDVCGILAGASAFRDITNFLTKAEQEIENFQRTGRFRSDVTNIKSERVTNIISSKDEGSKENVGDFTNNKARTLRRPTRSAALGDGQNVLNVAKPKGLKLERISEINSFDDATKMPPPQEPNRRGKSKNSELNLAIKQERDSDVIIQLGHISIIDLIDTENEIKEEPTRSTRTKTRAAVVKKGTDENDNTNQSSQESSSEKQQSTRAKKVKEPQGVLNVTKGTDSNLLQSNANINSIIDIKFNDGIEKSIQNTHTKKRTMAIKRNKLTQENEIVQNVPTQLTNTSSEEKESPKMKIKDKKTKAKRTHSSSPICSESKRQKSTESTTNRKISNKDKTFVKSPLKESKRTSPVDKTVVMYKPADTTVVLNKLPVANETVIVPKDKRMVVTTPLNKQVNLSDLITDDEDDATHSQTATKKPGKPIFYGFENSPVKQRVEAFEKLQAQQIARDPSPATKTKTKPAMDKQSKKKNGNILNPKVKNKGKILTLTPVRTGTKTLVTESASKSAKSAVKEVLLQPKSASALKTYQQDFIDREQRRQEKEVARKREALLQAKENEIKRKYEEQQLRVLRAKEPTIKAKQDMQEEPGKLQTTKYKHMPNEKSTKNDYQKCVAEEKKPQGEKVVRNTPTRHMKSTQAKNIPQKPPRYLDITAPLLPLEECYDSDDERSAGHFSRPEWTKRQKMLPALINVSLTSEEEMNAFFMCKATTPDLQVLFGRINPKKLKRTSSAIWRKPPRFTIMPIPNEEDENDIL